MMTAVDFPKQIRISADSVRDETTRFIWDHNELCPSAPARLPVFFATAHNMIRLQCEDHAVTDRIVDFMPTAVQMVMYTEQCVGQLPSRDERGLFVRDDELTAASIDELVADVADYVKNAFYATQQLPPMPVAFFLSLMYIARESKIANKLITDAFAQLQEAIIDRLDVTLVPENYVIEKTHMILL